MRYLTTLVAMTTALACGGETDGGGGPTLATELCAASETRCIGNATAKCAEGGLHWSVNDCGATAYCANDGASCEERQCPYVGQSKCKDYKTVSTCNELGSAISEKDCDLGTLCYAGACLEASCTDGDTVCGWRAVAVCEGGAWSETTCEAGEACIDGECAPQACLPQSTACKDGDDAVALQCDFAGTAYTQSKCSETEKCYDTYGVCLPKLKEDPPPIDEPDAGGADIEEDIVEDTAPPVDKGPPAELEPLDKAEVVVNGEKIVFTSHKNASYVETDSDLRITMDKGKQKVEISIKPIEEFDVGQFSSASASDTSVIVWYHDGSDLVGQAQFRYVSVDYELLLEKFQSKDGRVKGTFSGTLTDDGGATTIPFENGVFDVKRHD